MSIQDVPFGMAEQLLKDRTLLQEIADATLTVLLEHKLYMKLHGGYPIDLETECRAVIQRLGAPKGSTNV